MAASQDALAAVLAAALDISDLPFQRPTLQILDDANNLQAAFRQSVITLHRKEGAIHSFLNETFLLQFLQSHREHLLGDAFQTAFKLRKTPCVVLSLVKLQENEQCPFPGDIPDGQVYSASILHGILVETFYSIYFGIFSIPQGGESESPT
jgi:hypothetical protein